MTQLLKCVFGSIVTDCHPYLLFVCHFSCSQFWYIWRRVSRCFFSPLSTEATSLCHWWHK